jgi:nucleotide-binding universal stress UspA family protein
VNRDYPPESIIVGIDGSQAAVRAAVWAIDEAVSRDIPLRLVHVIDRHADATLHSHRLDGDYAEAERITHRTWLAVEATGKPVKLEVEILRGVPALMLDQASRSAAMIVVGWTSHNRSTRRNLGSIASDLSRSALCPVAVIQQHGAASLDGRWIVARVDDTLSSDAVLHQAKMEARLRKAPLLALTTGRDHDHADIDTAHAVRKRLAHHLAGLPADACEVPICSLRVSHGVLDYLAKNANLVQLAVVGADDPGLAVELTAPDADSILHHTSCSVLSVRGHISEGP